MLVLCIHFRQCSESEQHLTLSMEASKSSGRSAFFSLTTQKLYRIFSKIDRPIPNIRTCLPTISQVFLYGLLLYMPSYSIYSYTINKWISISRIWCNVYTLLSRNKASNVSRENRERECVWVTLSPLCCSPIADNCDRVCHDSNLIHIFTIYHTTIHNQIRIRTIWSTLYMTLSMLYIV